MDRRHFVSLLKQMEVGERVLVDRPNHACRQALTVLQQTPRENLPDGYLGDRSLADREEAVGMA